MSRDDAKKPTPTVRMNVDTTAAMTIRRSGSMNQSPSTVARTRAAHAATPNKRIFARIHSGSGFAAGSKGDAQHGIHPNFPVDIIFADSVLAVTQSFPADMRLRAEAVTIAADVARKSQREVAWG
jgi:hypothetical protein